MKPLGLRWSRRALDTLDAGLGYIAQFDPDAAHRLRVAILEALERIRRFPESGRMVPEEGDPDIREVLREPFRIMYGVPPGEIRILVVRRMERSSLEPGEIGADPAPNPD